MSTKYLFVTGGVCSSLGKGLASASIGLLLEKHNLKVSMLKIDPYLNVDPGTMNPFQHGEVYVTDDGAETDLDLGHYFRYTNSPLSRASNATSGQIYNAVISRERKGDYLGQTVQVIPHITDEIKRRILACAKQVEGTDIVLVEVGGTVGDIESLAILEAIRQFRQERPNACLNIHLTYIPLIRAAGEVKTKPTQHSVQGLRAIGIIPDIIICRCEQSLAQDLKDKISLFCSVPKNGVIEAVDVQQTIYELPLHFQAQGIDTLILEKLDLKPKQKTSLHEWETICKQIAQPKGTVTMGLIGKYVKHQDAYKSVIEAIHHGGIANGYKVEIRQFEADRLMEGGSIEENIQGCDGYLIPGGFGERGWMGKIAAAKYCRVNNIPYFGICLGMQALVTEYARNVASLPEANSTEVDPGTPDPVICLISEQEGIENLGGTMRLGAYPCRLTSGSKAAKIYDSEEISERHRHRYEFNNRYKAQLEEAGLLLSGICAERSLVEIAEVAGHPWMIGVQYHPEFQSKPTAPHPLFASFVKAMVEYQKK
ncbi:MAG: CTP synthase [Verrucomicrobia bacterium]|nr:CTP synthase [Verrucomicrobiota bacterium]